MDDEADSGKRFDSALSLGMILGRIRGELLDLGLCADRLQETISAVVARSATRLDASAQMELQAADALSQRIERLADLAGVLQAGVHGAPALDPDPKSSADIAHALSRLTGAGALSGHSTLAEEDDCEMF